MDPVTATYYAVVCAALAVVSARIPLILLRLVLGAGVGLVAAALLPQVRAGLGL